jgi:pimeloyl-ACP methyl ester carboxylesterase
MKKKANMKTILFIHGMFLNPKCWKNWTVYFDQQDYHCIAPAWPFHEGEPSALRRDIPAGLGALSLSSVIDEFARICALQSEPPIVIGHSMGGLIAQILESRGMAEAAVCINSVAPNAMLTLDWGFFKNSASIVNPLKGDQPYLMTEENFLQNFANAMTKAEAKQAYNDYAVHESRNVMRDAMGDAGKIDLSRPHFPLLFIAGDRDKIIPDKLNHKNAEAYTDSSSIADFKEFTGRGHFICGQHDWEDVADYISEWLSLRVSDHAVTW